MKGSSGREGGVEAYAKTKARDLFKWCPGSRLKVRIRYLQVELQVVALLKKRKKK